MRIFSENSEGVRWEPFDELSRFDSYINLFQNSPVHVEALAQVILAMAEKIDFSSLSNNFGFLGVCEYLQ